MGTVTDFREPEADWISVHADPNHHSLYFTRISLSSPMLPLGTCASFGVGFQGHTSEGPVS